MTTITIERAVLLRALEALRPATAPNGAKRDAAFEELRAALAAPATAPEQMPLERDCICHQDLHIDGYSGGAAPEGLYGALWVVVEGVGKKYVLADQSSEPKDMLAPATAPEKTVKEIMEFVRHYAANTFSSATLEDKIRRSLATPATAQVLTPLQDGEKIYALWHSSDANDLDDFLDGWRHAEAFHGITGGKP